MESFRRNIIIYKQHTLGILNHRGHDSASKWLDAECFWQERTGVGDKYATDVPKTKKIRGRENIAVGTWNVRTLRPAGKLEQLTHAMSRYHWNIVGLCEMRWKNFGEMSTDDGHKVYFSGEEGKHE